MTMKRTILTSLLLLAVLSGFAARRVLCIGDPITDGGKVGFRQQAGSISIEATGNATNSAAGFRIAME